MPKVTLRSSRSKNPDPDAAAEELVSRLEAPQAKLVTLFAARNADHGALNRAVRDRLPKGTRLIGASTGGEIDNQGFHSQTAQLSALSGDFDVGIGLGGGLAKDAMAAGSAAVKRACDELGIKQTELDPRKHVGVVIDDGFKFKKEELLLGVLEKNQALVLVGGGAADNEIDPQKGSAVVHVDGEVASDAALVAVFRTDAPWAALRTHWYEPSGEMVKITRVDGTRVLEIDGQPAVKRYAELCGVTTPEELEFGKPHGFSARPTALRVGREYFIRSPLMALPDGSILFANLLEDGTELELMRAGDAVSMTRRFFEEEIPRRVQAPSAALMFHCQGRAYASYLAGNLGELSSTFAAAPPCAGFNAYFEIYCGFQINTTLTSLVFGASA